MIRFLVIFTVFMAFAKCGELPSVEDSGTEKITDPAPLSLKLNLDHINHLYTEKPFNNTTIGLLHIYSEYPDYNYTIEPKEGFACVDDVSRAIVLLSGQEGASERVHKMTDFLLQMQNQNGYFNNFIWGDLTINKSYKTSQAKPDWWSWRALWALETVYPLFQQSNPSFAARINQATERLVINIQSSFKDSQATKTVKGIEVPTYLPYESAADQAAVLITGLIPHWERTGKEGLTKTIRTLANGISQMQLGQKGQFPFGVFLSWENLWHAYGNSQAYALLKAGQSLDDSSYIEKALVEIDNFYPFLLEQGFAEFMSFNMTKGDYSLIEKKPYPQIAYGIRPMVWACCEAYRVTGDHKYKVMASEILVWLTENNELQKAMYDPSTGRCYDGIISSSEINKNSGAESTIEALLSIQAYLGIDKE